MKSLVIGLVALFALAGCSGEEKPTEGAVELTDEQKTSLSESDGTGETIATPGGGTIEAAADTPE